MVKLAENSEADLVSGFCKNSLLGTKIASYINAYGFERDFFNVWYCVNDENKITSVISKFEDNITVLCDNDSEICETEQFIEMLGFSSLTCAEEAAERFHFGEYKSKRAFEFSGGCNCNEAEELSESDYKNAYKLICENIPDSFEDSKEAYLSFLSDFTFRKNRNLARIKGVKEDGKLLSCALTSSEAESSAVISGVACDRSLRKSGLGKKTVLSLVCELLSENKKVYVIALNESAEGFYEHIGFKYSTNISIFKRK